MLTSILASVGLPLLVKAVRTGISAIDHPVARTAAEALDGLDDAIGGGEIPPEQIAESNRHLERMAEIESEEATAALAQVNATFRTEARSEDAYVRRWRPTFGYVVALTWTLQMGALAWAVVADPIQAPPVFEAAANMSMMWGIALGVLGVAVHQRSRDKALDAASRDAESRAGTSGLEQLLRKLSG